jgi:hypothetical protein
LSAKSDFRENRLYLSKYLDIQFWVKNASGKCGELYNIQYVFSNLANLLSADENDQFWQKPRSYPDLTNQNGGIQIGPNWKTGAKIIHPV